MEKQEGYGNYLHGTLDKKYIVQMNLFKAKYFLELKFVESTTLKSRFPPSQFSLYSCLPHFQILDNPSDFNMR